MTRKQSPFAEVKDRFGTKDKLVDEVVSLLDLPRSERDVTRERLRVAANSKLLRLHDVAKEIKDRFGGRDKLVDEVLKFTGHPKDEDRKQKLVTYGPARLLGMHRKYSPAVPPPEEKKTEPKPKAKARAKAGTKPKAKSRTRATAKAADTKKKKTAKKTKTTAKKGKKKS